MKKLMILSIILMMFTTVMNAQVRFNVKLGASPGSNPRSASIFVNRENPFKEFQFNLVHTDPQYYGGVSAYVPLATPFFLEAGISYTKQTSQFLVDYTVPSELQNDNTLMSGSEEMILLPVNIGVTMGGFDITSGLRAIKTISHSSELTHLDGFHEDGNPIKLGWQIGARYAINRTLIGIEYMATLNRVCEGMYVNGQSLEIMNIPGSYVFSIQYRF
jgi:hypothetical protein